MKPFHTSSKERSTTQECLEAVRSVKTNCVSLAHIHKKSLSASGFAFDWAEAAPTDELFWLILEYSKRLFFLVVFFGVCVCEQ